MQYLQAEQEMFYQARVGTIYGCFMVEKVDYDWEKHRQTWTLRCVHCGFEKQTHNGKDYVKGKNKGTCKCQRVKNAPVKIVEKQKKPRQRDHELYRRWVGMKRRCNSENNKDYHNYGGRGIKMCPEWEHDFMAFVKWAEGNGYEKDLTIDRIDNNKGYSPENCRWIARGDQGKNKRNVKLYGGETLPDFCKRTGLNYSVMSKEIQRGRSFSEALSIAVGYKIDRNFGEKCMENGVKRGTVLARVRRGVPPEIALQKDGALGIEINGESKRLSEWCKIYGITGQAVHYRMKTLGMSYQEAITKPKTPGIHKGNSDPEKIAQKQKGGK